MKSAAWSNLAATRLRHPLRAHRFFCVASAEGPSELNPKINRAPELIRAVCAARTAVPPSTSPQPLTSASLFAHSLLQPWTISFCSASLRYWTTHTSNSNTGDRMDLQPGMASLSSAFSGSTSCQNLCYAFVTRSTCGICLTSSSAA